MNIEFLCDELMLHISNVIVDLNKTKLKAYSWELERISKGIHVIKTLSSEISSETLSNCEKSKAEVKKFTKTYEALLNIQYALADSCKRYSQSFERIKELCENQDLYKGRQALATQILKLIENMEEAEY